MTLIHFGPYIFFLPSYIARLCRTGTEKKEEPSRACLLCDHLCVCAVVNIPGSGS